ncbi:hypothetical protein [Peribacillus kribbensis]|uniref:hypothetical protein n=1 Tax=Peribacillus kribbensis TaxID=356658 RepID=UPI00041C78A8|nr:hypothetical protein [Peribacillus kribbensis]
MFGISDLGTFFAAFFIVVPLVTFIHLAGHIFFAGLFGGSEKRIIIGCGKKLFSFWKIEIRLFYFWNGGCEFTSLKYNNRVSNTLIFLGGALFNLASILISNVIIRLGYLEASGYTYQFQYFSFITMFFSLFPMHFQDGIPSDGRAVWLLWRNRIKDKYTADLAFKRKEEREMDITTETRNKEQHGNARHGSK